MLKRISSKFSYPYLDYPAYYKNLSFSTKILKVFNKVKNNQILVKNFDVLKENKILPPEYFKPFSYKSISTYTAFKITGNLFDKDLQSSKFTNDEMRLMIPLKYSKLTKDISLSYESQNYSYITSNGFYSSHIKSINDTSLCLSTDFYLYKDIKLYLKHESDNEFTFDYINYNGKILLKNDNEFIHYLKKVLSIYINSLFYYHSTIHNICENIMITNENMFTNKNHVLYKFLKEYQSNVFDIQNLTRKIAFDSKDNLLVDTIINKLSFEEKGKIIKYYHDLGLDRLFFYKHIDTKHKYPFIDDMREVSNAIDDYVKNFVIENWESEEKLLLDVELQSFYTEMASIFKDFNKPYNQNNFIIMLQKIICINTLLHHCDVHDISSLAYVSDRNYFPSKYSLKEGYPVKNDTINSLTFSTGLDRSVDNNIMNSDNFKNTNSFKDFRCKLEAIENKINIANKNRPVPIFAVLPSHILKGVNF
jgi:hypothetical protein